MHVIVTAGHVDHGKTSLVDALTGMRSDRLPEEHRRSMSIELGYVWTRLRGVGEVAFVDVPGHERFIATTIAGFGPASAAMLVVAADDPWMPQAEEHLLALEALGYTSMVIAITRCDLKDPTATRQAVERRLRGTALAGSEIVETSARNGAGLDRLRAALAVMLQRKAAPDPQRAVRLWIDRRFTVRGSGTVVTGTLDAGTISRGELLASEDTFVRVRGLHALGHDRRVVVGPARVALNVGGKGAQALGRGSALVTPNGWLTTHTFDGRLTPTGLRPPRAPVLHVGTAALVVHLRILGDAIVRVQSPVAIPLHVGDVAILRDPGQRRTWRLMVLDPAPSLLNRRGAARERAADLDAVPVHPSLPSELTRRGLVEAGLLQRMGVPVEPLPDGTVHCGSYLLDAAHAHRLREALVVELVGEAARGSVGLPPAVAAQRIGLPNVELVAALAEPPIYLEDGLLRHVPEGIEVETRRIVQRISDRLAGRWISPLTDDLIAEVGLDPFFLRRATQAGLLIECPGGTLFVAPAESAAITVLTRLEQPFSASRARVAFGVSRRHALDLLALLEDRGRVGRLSDGTRVVHF